MLHNIIVVCTGNICRSPIAEAILRTKLSGGKYQICSAGIAALIDYPADPLAQAVALEIGEDLSAHRAQQASQALLASMDLILTLDNTHSEWIFKRFPEFQGRTHKLGRWRNNANVADPYRKPKAAFEQARSEIIQYVDDWAKRIKST